MRCNFCGFNNPDDKKTCEKCNKPLTSSVAEEVAAAHVNVSTEANHSRPTERQPTGAFNPKATVLENSVVGKSNNAGESKCPKCGVTLDDGGCPNCGYQAGTKKPEHDNDATDLRKTIRPNRKDEKCGGFKLIPISEKTGTPEGEELSYEGNTIVLNRDNTDPKNTTITSHEQASLSYENGIWSIEDKSEYKTTFVQAARKIELQQGDLILLGNQLYRFEL